MDYNEKIPVLIIVIGAFVLAYVFLKDFVALEHYIALFLLLIFAYNIPLVFPKLTSKIIPRKLEFSEANMMVKGNILVVKKDKTVSGLAVYVVDDVPYSYKDVTSDFLIQQIRSFTGFITATESDVSIVLLKKKANTSSYVKNIERQLINYKIMVATDPANPQILKKLRRLEKIYDRIVKGEKPISIKYYIVVKAHASSERGLIKAIQERSRTVITSFKASMGFDVRKATEDEVLEAISLGILKETKHKITLESDVGFMMPIGYVKRPKVSGKGIYLGEDIDYGTPVFYDFEKYLTKHIVVIGPTGRGKTTFLYTIAKRAIDEYEIPVWIFDLRGEFIGLKSTSAFEIIDPERNNINILYTWFTSPRIRAKQIIELIKSIASLTSKEEYLLYMSLIKTYESTNNPSFEYLMSTIAEISKNYGDKDVEFSLLTKLESLKSKIFFNGNVYALNFKRPLIFLLHRLPEEYRKLYTLALLQILANYILTLTPTNTIRCLVILDEAWRFMDTRSGAKIIKSLVKEGRGYGLAVALASQDISDFPKEILDNAGTIAVFGSNSKDYIESVSKFMKLNETEKERMSWLRTGEVLIRIIGDPRPLWVKIRPELVETQEKQIKK